MQTGDFKSQETLVSNKMNDMSNFPFHHNVTLKCVQVEMDYFTEVASVIYWAYALC